MARPRTYLNAALPPITVGGSLPTHDAEFRPLIRLQTLGAAMILVGDTRLTVAAGTLFSLLLRLTSASGMQLSREVLRHALWPDQDDDRQRANLRQSLYKLRGYGVRVSLHGDIVQVDATQVLRTFAFDRTSETFDRDVTLGHEPFGAFLPGFSVPWPEFQEWLDVQRESVHAEVRRVLVDQLRRRRDRADWAGADALARWLLLFDPLNEEATLTVAECMALAGSKKEAVAMLDRYLGELGPQAGDLRLQATMLRRRIVEPASRGRVSFAPTERHFVGREDELAALTLSMRRARWHDGSAVLLHGAPGIGKSRLASELEKVAVIEGVRVVRTSCRESDLQRPMSVFLDLVPEWLSLSGALGCAPESLVALRRLVPPERTPSDVMFTREDDAAQSSPVIPPLGASRLPDPAPVHVSPDAMPMVSSIRRAILDLVAAVSDEKPMLIIVDDVHWIDEHSWEVLADLIERTSAMRVFALVTSREPHARPLRPQRVPLALQLRFVHPLSPENCLFLSRAIGNDFAAQVSDVLGATFVDRSEGNPLFLHALVHQWVETGESIGVPSTIRAAIDSRLAQLGRDAMRVLQLSSILGKWASCDRVAATLELRTNELLSCIEQLERLGVIARGEAQTIAAHDLLSQAALFALSPLAKKTLHRRIAEAILSDAKPPIARELLLFALTNLELSGDTEFLTRATIANLPLILDAGVPSDGLRALERLSGLPLREVEKAKISGAKALLLLGAGEYRKAIADPLRDLLLPSAASVTLDSQATIALTLADSSYRADPLVNRETLAQLTIGIACSEHLSRTVRLRAADSGLIIVSNECDLVSATRLFESSSISEMDIEEDDACRRIAILYHTVFGDRKIARRVAETLFRCAAVAEASPQAYHQAMRAGFAQRIVADDDSHFVSLGLAFSIAERSGTPSHALNAAWLLAQSHLEAGNHAEVQIWTSAMLRLQREISDAVTSNFALAFHCRLAIESHDSVNARAIYSEYVTNLRRMPTLRESSYVLALDIAIGLLDPSWTPTEAMLTSISSRQLKIGSFGTSDFLTSVMLDAMIRDNDSLSAFAKLSYYTGSQRREIGPLSVRLKEVRDRLSGCTG